MPDLGKEESEQAVELLSALLANEASVLQCEQAVRLIRRLESRTLARVLSEVGDRRSEHDSEYAGGPEEDDMWDRNDWKYFIVKHNERAAEAVSQDEFEDAMFDIAALAVAAIQSSRRKRV